MIRTSLLSAAALSLAIAAPAYAQTSGPFDMEQVREKLGEAGVEESRDFGGQLFRAQTEDGRTVFMMLTRRDLGDDSEIDLSEEDVRERFQDAGFTMVTPVTGAEFIIGDLDDDISVIVMGAHDLQDPTAATGAVPPPTPATGMGAPGATGAPGTPGAPGMDAPGATPPPGGTMDSPLPGAPEQPGAPPRQPQ